MSAPANSRRGGTVFYAFDPWETCLKLPPGSFRYFHAAEKANLLSSQEALNLCRLLLDRCRQTSACYSGHFSSYFQQNHVKIYLQHAQDYDYLLRTGLALGSACADTLFETCPWPVVPERHFVTKAFSDARVDRDIYHYLEDPWSTWNEALEITCLGPWLGIKPEQASAIMTILQPYANSRAARQTHSELAKYSAHKVTIPFFSHGFQGIVAGFFTEVPDDQKDAIFTTLWQFGQTMSDAYSAYRGQQFLDILQTQYNAESLAKAVINLAGPIKSVIVELDGKRAGYRLKHESGYWAGYELLNTPDIAPLLNSCRRLCLPNPFRTGCALYIEPVTGIPLFDSEFSIKRVENCISQFARMACPATATSALTLQQAESMRDQLVPYISNGNASLAKWRQFYVVDKVINNWRLGGAPVSNNELKLFLEGKIGHPLKNGYQISSYIKELESTFEQKLKISKTRTGVVLTWSHSQ
jgi:hypothetical protein